MNQIKKYIPIILAFTPLFALAVSNIQDLATFVTNILGNYIIPALFAVALIIFLWGVIQYVIAAGDDEKRKEGKQKIIWGIIGLFVMVAIWGLVNLIGNTFNLNTSAPPYPQF